MEVILILFLILMDMMRRIIILDITEDLLIENLLVDLKDVDMGQVDLVLDLNKGAVDLNMTQLDLALDLKNVDKDNGDLVADLKENEAIFEMTCTLEAIKIIKFWKMYV